jgi:hypothetical protein
VTAEPETAFEQQVREISEEILRRGPVEVVRAPPPPRPKARVVPAGSLRKSRRPDALDRDPEGTVAKARGLYLRALGRDPTDKTGAVARLKEGAYIIAREAERRRLERDAAATKAKWDALLRSSQGRGRGTLRRFWASLPLTGEPDPIYPELDDEVALTKGEWIEAVNIHREASIGSMVDHAASMIPPNPGESHKEWRERLGRRTEGWFAATDEAVVNRSLYAQPRPAAPRSPERSRTGAARKARKPRSRQSSKGRPASTPR